MIIVGASAYPRVIDFARIRRDRRRGRRAAHGRHGAHRRPRRRGVHPSPVPHADFVTTTTHKTLRGPRGGMILCQRAVREGRSTSAVFPGMQGGPLMHVIAAKAVVLQGSARAGVQGLPAADRRQRAGAGRRRSSTRGFRLVSRRHRQPPDAGRRLLARASPARSPKTRSTRPASPSTRTRSRSIPRSPIGQPAASASARPRSPRAACASRRWRRSRSSSARRSRSRKIPRTWREFAAR